MSSLIIKKCFLLFGIIMLLHVQGGYLTQIRTFNVSVGKGYTIYMNTDIEPCNETITLSDIGGVGQLVYYHDRRMSTQLCKTVIKAEPGYRIGYAFSKKSAYRTIYSQNDHLYYICTSVVFYRDDVERRYNCLNASSNSIPQVDTTQDNTLTLQIFGDDSTSFSFELVFFSFHYGICRSNETSCRLMGNAHAYACIDQNSIQHNISFFCDWNYRDIYPDYDDRNNGLIAGIVLTCIIFVPMLFIGACLVYRRYCKQPETEVEDIPTRARRIFAAIYEDVHDNAGFDTGSIDPSKFDPPPEYDTLAQLDEVNTDGSVFNCDERLSEISKENLPSYLDVMKNSNEYLVSCHM